MKNNQTKFRRFLCIDWDRHGFLIYLWNLSFAQTFRKPERHVVNYVSQEAFQDREPIKAREKHYSKHPRIRT